MIATQVHVRHAGRARAGNLVLVLVLVAIILALYLSNRVIDIWQEKEKLRRALSYLTSEDVIGYAKVLSVGPDSTLRIRLVECNRANRFEFINDRTLDLKGNQVFFDLLVVKFHDQLVMDGKEKAMYLWRRVYTETMTPEGGIQINGYGLQPARYRDIAEKLGFSAASVTEFWRQVWDLANDPGKLSAQGVTAINGKAVYSDFRPGRMYRLVLSTTGEPTIAVDPDLSAEESKKVESL